MHLSFSNVGDETLIGGSIKAGYESHFIVNIVSRKYVKAGY